MSGHTRSKNGRKGYIELKGHFKTEYYEETKEYKANTILQNAHYDGNRKFKLKHYYNFVANAFVQLEEVFTVYKLPEAHKINSFENGLNEPKYIKFSITEKRDWNKLPANQ